MVNTHEETGSRLIVRKNVNYSRDVLAVLNMVKQNVFGELVHFKCGYQHDLRGVKFNDGKTAYGKGVEFGEKGISDSKWRTQHSLLRNADVYQTHYAGPIARIWDINYKMAKEKIAPPTDAIDAAAWTVITSLSEVSIENNG